MDRYYVWEIISYAWTEIGIKEDECLRLVEKSGIRSEDLAEVDRICFRDVCGSFAYDSFLIFPLFLWMNMPDWGYNEEYLKKRMSTWYSRPVWHHFLNPMRWFGYPVALLLALKCRAMLHRTVHAKGHA